MKTYIKQLAVAAATLILLSFNYNGGGKDRATFTVYGKCGMCEERIENTLNKVDGIVWADWEIATQELTVKYDANKITLDEIKRQLADIGHDTEDVRATEEAYNNLHKCCKYDRPEKK